MDRRKYKANRIIAVIELMDNLIEDLNLSAFDRNNEILILTKVSLSPERSSIPLNPPINEDLDEADEGLNPHLAGGRLGDKRVTSVGVLAQRKSRIFP